MYLSSLLQRQIYNKSGEKIGKVVELVATNLNASLPAVRGFIASRGVRSRAFFIPIQDIAEIGNKDIRLKTDTINFTPFIQREEEVLLAKDILDKQIVDVKERQLTRINDLELNVSNGNLFLQAADVSFRALLNRLGFPTWGLLFKYSGIPWEDIQFLGVDFPVKVKIDYEKLETLHPADIARFIFRGPGYREGSRIIQSLEGDIAADVVESLPIEFQANILENMSVSAAGKIFSEMESHHAADLLAALNEEKKQQILEKISPAQTKIIRELLTYPTGTAGALMKVEFVSIPKSITVEELYLKLQNSPKLPEFLLYFYISENDDFRKIAGIVSVWELFRSSPRTRMEAIMVTNILTARPLESWRSVLKKMIQYDLSAIPVINPHDHILGIVTLTHAIKLLVPKNWQSRLDLTRK